MNTLSGEPRSIAALAGDGTGARRDRVWRADLKADLTLLLVTAIWGTTFVVVKEALRELPPFTFIALRFTLGTIVLAVLFGRRLRGLSWSDARAGIIVGIFLFSGFALQTLGLQRTPASVAGFITGLSVVIVPIAAFLWLGHRPAKGTILGVGAATVGLGLIALRDDLSIAPGDVLVLLCAIAFALQIVAVGKFAPKMDSLVLTLLQLGFVSVASWGVAFAVERPAFVLTPELAGAVLFLGVVATALVLALQNYAQRHTSPTHTALIFTMEPVFAAFFANLWLAEELTVRAAMGGALILVGMLSAVLWPERRS